MRTTNFLVTGVGGQGVILASEILGTVGVTAGRDVKKSEMRGVAQRGGAVLAHVRWGDHVCSPIAPEGQLDYLMAFEILEALRWADDVSREGSILLNEQKVAPLSATGETLPYPDDERIEELLRPAAQHVYRIPALALGQELGNARVMNVVMLGALSELVSVDMEVWRDGIRAHVPSHLVELNQCAFESGRDWIQKNGNSAR